MPAGLDDCLFFLHLFSWPSSLGTFEQSDLLQRLVVVMYICDGRCIASHIGRSRLTDIFHVP